jgi:hypothetical protein
VGLLKDGMVRGERGCGALHEHSPMLTDVGTRGLRSVMRLWKVMVHVYAPENRRGSLLGYTGLRVTDTVPRAELVACDSVTVEGGTTTRGRVG